LRIRIQILEETTSKSLGSCNFGNLSAKLTSLLPGDEVLKFLWSKSISSLLPSNQVFKFRLLVQILEKATSKICFADLSTNLTCLLPGDEVLKFLWSKSISSLLPSNQVFKFWLLVQILEETTSENLGSGNFGNLSAELTSLLPGDEVLKFRIHSVKVLKILWSKSISSLLPSDEVFKLWFLV